MTDLSVNTFIVLLILCMYNTVQSTSDTQTISLEIGRSLQDAMKTWFDNDQITKAYNLQTYQTYTGREILEKIKKNVTKQFLSSEDSLTKIRESALQSFYNYSGDTSDFDFLERFKNRTQKDKPISYYKTENFNRKVSITNSSLVLPTDVYYNWSKVRETILWTASMDNAFKANWSPNLTGSATLLQYIGSPHGVMRAYPSYYTPRVGKWVTYDHRFRIWYAVGAMESNKVVFLMDKSGTLVGEPVKLMREMAINIIKTMISDEDYISVLTFNQVVEPLGCGARLVRARSRVKKILNAQIRRISPSGSGNLTEALRVGFDVLTNSKTPRTCHSTLVLFTDYTQIDVAALLREYNIDESVKLVILQVGDDIMFATKLKSVARSVGAIYARIGDLSDISPTILMLTSTYTHIVDSSDLQAKTTPMYKDASTEEYITTIVLPIITDKKANWTKSSTLQQDKGSFLGVAAVDIEAKSLGQYPLSNARGCYSITVDVKGSVLYHPVLYRTKQTIDVDQKLHLYSYLNDGTTMKYVERGMVFQNFTQTAQLPFVEVSDSAQSLGLRSFVNNQFFNVLIAVKNKTSLLHICNRERIAFPINKNVEKRRVSDVIFQDMGLQVDDSRNTAYCSYSTFTKNRFKDFQSQLETVEQYINRIFMFPECKDFAFEIFDDIFMVTNHLKTFLDKDQGLSVTTAAGNRFQVIHGKLQRINAPFSRESYTRLVSLITNDNNNHRMVTVTNNTSQFFEMSQIIYHLTSDSYPLMLSVKITAVQLERIIQKPFRELKAEMGGKRYLVDENGFVISTSSRKTYELHLARSWQWAVVARNKQNFIFISFNAAKLLPHLMEHLLEKGIYNMYNHTQCSFTCEEMYPINSIQTSSASSTILRLLGQSSYSLLQDVLFSAVSFLSTFANTLIFLLLNPVLSVTSMPSSEGYKEDWKAIKINLTCCQTHPFVSRNFSVEVKFGSMDSIDDSCLKSYKYSRVPDTNLLFVWDFCSECLCDVEPEYNLHVYPDLILDPCADSDLNYSPANQCTSNSTRRARIPNAGAQKAQTLHKPLFWACLFAYIVLFCS